MINPWDGVESIWEWRIGSLSLRIQLIIHPPLNTRKLSKKKNYLLFIIVTTGTARRSQETSFEWCSIHASKAQKYLHSDHSESKCWVMRGPPLCLHVWWLDDVSPLKKACSKECFTSMAHALLLFIVFFFSSPPPPPRDSHIQAWMCTERIECYRSRSFLLIRENAVIDLKTFS